MPNLDCAATHHSEGHAFSRSYANLVLNHQSLSIYQPVLWDCTCWQKEKGHLPKQYLLPYLLLSGCVQPRPAISASAPPLRAQPPTPAGTHNTQ